jgi:aspartate aminotransferase-like enzyme
MAVTVLKVRQAPGWRDRVLAVMSARELTVRRLGNDEAAILLVGDHDAYSADQVARTVRALLDEGLDAAWERHRRVGARLHDALPELGFRLAAEHGHQLPELTAAWLPEGADDAALRKALLETYGIEVGGGLGEFAGKAWRIGLMGHSARDRSVTTLLGALRELLA